MALLFEALSPLIRRLPPEWARDLVFGAMERGFGARSPIPDDPILSCHVWDLAFANPVGLAAGFDKDARALDVLASRGFGFIEAGTVTPKPQPGNGRPRMFRLEEDEAVINRLGFNSEGLAAFSERVRRFAEAPGRGLVVLGANVGMNRDSTDAVRDYVMGVRTLSDDVDYLVINVSSPNTPGLRDLQDRGHLEELVGAVRETVERFASGRKPPLLLKISPDLERMQLEAVAEVALRLPLDGLVVSNTTVARPRSLRSGNRDQAGGLSGRPLFELSTRMLAAVYELTRGRIPLIGVGGVASGEDVYRKIRSGASLVQLYTALAYHGPDLVDRIKRDLSALLRRDGFANVSDAIGADADLWGKCAA